MMKLLVGLGNPGETYARNRHNIGFMVLDEIAKAYNFTPWRSRFKGETAEGLIDGQKCLLLKPLTFMNLSGEAVQAASSFYKINLEDIIVFHDEIDLPPAKIKIKTDGGNAGHNGLKSISQHVGNAYVRVRLGVGRPAQKSQVANFVLKDFSKDDANWLEDALRSLSRHAGLLVSDNQSDFINKISDDLRDYFPKKAKKAKTENNTIPKPQSPEGVVIKKEKYRSRPDKNASSDSKPASKEETKSTDKSALSAALEKWLNKGDDT